MTERIREELLERLGREPWDLDSWQALARELRRSPGPLPELASHRNADGMFRALARAPHERRLAELWLETCGLEALPRREREPGGFWRRSGRLGREGEHFFDTETGAPLFLRLPGCGLVLAWIPPGEVPREGGDATLLERGFWLGVHPVTRAEYREVTGEDPHVFAEDAPASWLTFPQALRFAGLAEAGLNGERGPPAGWSLRLPSELEWRRAAGTVPAGRWQEHGWFQENAPGRLVPVERHTPGELGLHDCWGNVREWVLDRWGQDPARLSAGGEPFLRGGHPGERVTLGGDAATPSSNLRGVPRARGVATIRRPGGHGFRIGLFPPPGLDHPAPGSRQELLSWLTEFEALSAAELLSGEETGRFRRAVEELSSGPDREATARLLRAFSGDVLSGESFSGEELGAWRTGERLYPAVRSAARALEDGPLEEILGELYQDPVTDRRTRLLGLRLACPAHRAVYRSSLGSTAPAERAAAARLLREVATEEDRKLARKLLRGETDRRVRVELAELASATDRA